MLAVKGNRVYQVDKVTKATYLKDGFAITDDAGKVLEQPTNKTVPWAEHEVLVKAHKELVEAYGVLEEKLAALGGGQEPEQPAEEPEKEPASSKKKA